MKREEFKKSQEQMVKNWIEGVKNLVVDFEAYRRGREQAYLGRWSEAMRFLRPGDRILDIGGGALYRDLLNFIKSHKLIYYYQDITTSVVRDSQRLAVEMGFEEENFREGFNDELDYPTNFFDAVFSSHCLEHSFDIKKTFLELNRIIKENGYLLMAVPLGWEENPEHPYFFSPNEWIALLEDNGFEVRVAQTGREYPESGWDYFIGAKKIGVPAQVQRIDPSLFLKDNFIFIPRDDASITYKGVKKPVGHLAYDLYEGEREIIINTPAPYKHILPIFAHHDYSGNIMTVAKEYAQFFTLYSWFTYVHPELVVMDGMTELVVKSVGKSFCSCGNEIVFYGYLVPREAEFSKGGI